MKPRQRLVSRLRYPPRLAKPRHSPQTFPDSVVKRGERHTMSPPLASVSECWGRWAATEEPVGGGSRGAADSSLAVAESRLSDAVLEVGHAPLRPPSAPRTSSPLPPNVTRRRRRVTGGETR